MSFIATYFQYCSEMLVYEPGEREDNFGNGLSLTFFRGYSLSEKLGKICGDTETDICYHFSSCVSACLNSHGHVCVLTPSLYK